MRHLFSRKNLLRNPATLPHRNRVLLAFDKFDEGDFRRRSVGLVAARVRHDLSDTPDEAPIAIIGCSPHESAR